MSLDLDSWDQGRWRQEGRSALWSKTVGLRVFTLHCFSSSLSLHCQITFTSLLLVKCTNTIEVKSKKYIRLKKSCASNITLTCLYQNIFVHVKTVNDELPAQNKRIWWFSEDMMKCLSDPTDSTSGYQTTGVSPSPQKMYRHMSKICVGSSIDPYWKNTLDALKSGAIDETQP